MTRNHRRWHAWTWLVLGPLIALGFVVGLLVRPAPVVEQTPSLTHGNSLKAAVKANPREATP
jgi:hypothetical protein